MRIISGTARGVPITCPKTLTRPTSDRVREAVFSILGPSRIRNASVLDLFAGSGGLGLEALSRGAKGALFVDQSSTACQAIRANLEKTRLDGGTVRKSSVSRFLKQFAGSSKVDLIFADPPYKRKPEEPDHTTGLLDSTSGLAGCLSSDGVFVLECSVDTSPPQAPGWADIDRRDYGNTRIVFYAFVTSSSSQTPPGP